MACNAYDANQQTIAEQAAEIERLKSYLEKIGIYLENQIVASGSINACKRIVSAALQAQEVAK